MIWLIILLVYVTDMRNEEDVFKVQKVYFLENDFWCIDQLKTDTGYLCRIGINLECKNVFTNGFECFSQTCYLLRSTNFGYVALEKSMIEDINSFLKSPEVDKFLLRLHFLFTDRQINNLRYFEGYKGKIQERVTYKLPEKISENIINLKCDVSTDTRKKYIKGKFKGFIWMKILNFNEYIKNLDQKEIKKWQQEKMDDNIDFTLYYFKNYSECFENLKKFIVSLRYFKLLEDNVSESFTDEFSRMFIDMTTTLKVSQFEEYYANFIKLYGYETNVDWKLLSDECLNSFKKKILNNKIFFPIGKNYSINYYIGHLSNLIFGLLKEIQKKYNTLNHKNRDSILLEINYSLKCALRKLQLSAVQDLCESDYIPKHFSKLLEREVKTFDDHIEVEKMVCDYYNMFAYIFNFYYGFNKNSSVSYSYTSPISTDNYNLRIVDGIKIKFKRFAKFKRVKWFDDKGKEVIMIKGTDYFIAKLIKLYCPSNILKMKNIHEIEVFSSDDEKNNKRFKIIEYLSV